MRVTIHYEYDPLYPNLRFTWSKDSADGRKIYGKGMTWAEAKCALVESLREEAYRVRPAIPPDEQVEI